MNTSFQIKRRPPAVRRLVVAIAMGLSPSLAAQVAPQPGGPGFDHAANGVPIVNIVAPSAAGVSHNRYDRYNVDPRGLVLNNGTGIVGTQLAGQILGNPHLAPGQAARIILNEVTSTHPSHLGGYTEVAGARADVVVANPNGITCAGCGFINTDRVTLTTGVPVMGGSGSLEAFRVRGGVVSLNGDTIDLRNTTSFEVIARAAQVNAKVWADRLHVVTGANEVNYATRDARPIDSDGSAVGVSLDVAAVGGLYASHIRLVGTEAGLGVNNGGDIAAQFGDVDILNDGRVVLAGNTAAAGNVTIRASELHNGGVLSAHGAITLSAGAIANRGSVASQGAITLHGSALDNSGSVHSGAGIDVHAGSARNTGSVYASGNSVWRVADQLTNEGTLAAAGHLDLAAGRILSTGVLGAGVQGDGSLGSSGTLRAVAEGALMAYGTQLAAGGLTLQGGSLDLSGSKTRAGGDIVLQSTAGDLRHQGADTATAGALTLRAAGTLDNVAGMLVGHAVVLSARDAILNGGGTIQADQGASIEAARLDNADGRIAQLGAQALALRVGALVSTGFIGSNGALLLDAGDVNNAGTLYGAIGLTGTVAGNLLNRGAIQSGGDVTLSAGGVLDNQGGRIEAGSEGVANALVIRATSVSNRQGRIANGGVGLTRIEASGVIDNVAGTLGGQGDVQLHAGTLDNREGGKLVAGRDLGLGLSSLENGGGTVYAAGSLQWDGGAGSLHNAWGKFGAGGDVWLTLAWLENLGGEVAAEGNVSLQLGALGVTGRMVAGRDLALSLPGDYTHVAGATLKANGQLSLLLGGHFFNRHGAVLDSAGGITLDAAHIHNDAGARISSAHTVLRARGGLFNAGRLEGDTLTVQGTDVVNEGVLVGDNVTVRAWNFTNGVDLGQITGNDPYTTALVAASERLSLYVGGTVLNRDAHLYSLGDLIIAADESGARSQAILNRSGSIEADGSMVLAAQQITNERRLFEVDRHVLSEEEQRANTRRSESYLSPWDDATATDFCNSQPSNWRCKSENMRRTDIWTVTAIHRLGRHSGESRIVAGGNIQLSGSVRNHTSTLAAAHHLIINGAAQGHGLATGRIGGERIENIAFEPWTEISHHVVRSITMQKKERCAGGTKWCWNDQGRREFGHESDLALPGDGDYSFITLPPGLSLASRITAGEALEIVGESIDNTHVGEDSDLVSGVALGANADAGAIGGTDPGGVGSQTVGTLPIRPGDGGLFTFRPGAGQRYLIESDPRFATRAGLLGSDYLLSRLGIEGDRLLKRLGDAFYEQRLVLDQITSLTGQRYLGDYGDAMAQYRALMDAGVQTAERFQLAVGVALTGEQMAQLTRDIVWMVSKEVNGEQVLVPVVYLATDTAKKVASGASLSGATVALSASGNVTNTGSIAARDSALLKAGNLLNTGTLSAGGTLGVDASHTILNAGRIDGGQVSLVAGQDIVTGMGLARLDLGVPLLNLGRADAATRGLDGGVHAAQDLAVAAGRDLTLNSATLTAGGDASLTAGRDLALNATRQTASAGSATSLSQATVHTTSAVQAGGSAMLAAGRDLLSQGATVKAGDVAVLSAGRDVVLNAVTDSLTTQASRREGKTSITTATYDEALRGTTLDGAGGVIVSAGRDVQTTAATLTSDAGNIALTAGRDVVLDAGVETHTWEETRRSKKSGLLSSTTTTTRDATDDRLAIGTLLRGDHVTVAAGQDVVVRGADVVASGNLTVAAARDVRLEATHDLYRETHETTVKKSGVTLDNGGVLMAQGKRTVKQTSIDQSVARGTLLSGDAVTVAAGRDVIGQGAQIAGTHDVLLAAGRDLSLGTAENRYTEDHDTTVTTTGYSRNGLNQHIGKGKDSRGERIDQLTHTGSLVGSTDGQVTLSAAGNLHLTGTDVLSQTGTTLVGKQVTLDAAVDTVDTRAYEKHSQTGITGGLGGATVGLVQDAVYGTKRATGSGDTRLKALYAAKAAYAVADGIGVASNLAAAGSAGDAMAASGINVQAEIGGSSASTVTTTHDDIARGSHIRSQGDVTIAATGGDLTIIGSQIAGKNVALAAAHDLNVLSQAEHHRLKNDSKNSSGGIGVSFGSDGLGVYAQASIGNGKARGNGTTHAESLIHAGDTLTLISGNDTTLQGAQLTGERIVATVGNHLTIRSEQDTDDYASKTMQAGGKVMVGLTQSGFASASGYYSKSTIDSQYTGVNEVSGLQAGAGGYDIYVGGTTHLVGGKIASTANAANNRLDTGNLITESLHNVSRYDAKQISVSGGSTMASNIAGGIGAALSMAVPQHENESSETTSAIANGAIVVRNNPGQDLSGLDRNASLDNVALTNVFDPNKVAQRQEMGQLAGEVGFRAAGDLADQMHWPEGSNERTVLHGLVGAAASALGGGDALSGAAAAAANQKVIPAMADYLVSQGYVPGSPEYDTMMQVASTAVGAVVGGGEGATVALDGTKYNYLRHDQRTEKEADVAGCAGDAACQRRVEDHWTAVSAEQSVAMTEAYKDTMDPAIYQQLLDTKPGTPKYDELLAQGMGGVLGANGPGTGIALGLVTQNDGEPMYSGLVGGLTAYDKSRLEMGMLGPLFGGPAAATAAFGGTPEQVSAAGQFGFDTMAMATAGRWGSAQAELKIADDAVAKAYADTGIGWGRGLQNQGMPWEDFLETRLPVGTRLPPDFKTFDFYDRISRTAISAKTLDTMTESKIINPRQLYTSIKKNVDDAVKFEDYYRSTIFLDSSMIDVRELRVAVPATTNATQWRHIQQAVRYGEANGVRVIVTPVSN